MAQQELYGNTYTLVHGTYTLEGILDIKAVQNGGPEPEQKEITRAGHTVFTYLPDPLGSKGQGTLALTVTVQASSNAFVDSKATKIPANTPAVTVWAMEPGTANANELTATMQLLSRTTKIPWGALATTVLEFGCNGVGVWDSPA